LLESLRKQFDVVETICTNGSIGVARLLRDNSGGSFDIGKTSFQDNETCLHLAVANGRVDMVHYLLAEYPHLANQPTLSLNETPLFYVMSKLKDQP